MLVNLADFIPLFGALITLLILVSMMLRARNISVAGYVLLVFLFVCFLSLLLKFLDHTGYIVHYIHLTRVNHLLGILRPPLFFLYIYFAVHPRPRSSWWHLAHFLPFAVLLVYLSPYLLLPADLKYGLYAGRNPAHTGRLPGCYAWWGLFYSTAYLLWSGYVFVLALRRPGFLKPPVKYWIGLFLASHVFFIAGALALRLFSLGREWDYLSFHILTLFIILCCITLLTNGHITEATRTRQTAPNLSGQKKAVYETLVRLIEVEKLYLNDRLRLKDLAQKAGQPEYLVSQVINEGAGVSFVELINQLRVEEAKNRLTDPAYFHLTIEAIGAGAGFNTKAAFYAAFKKQTGLTPAAYKRRASR